MHSSFYSFSIPLDHSGVMGIRPSGFFGQVDFYRECRPQGSPLLPTLLILNWRLSLSLLVSLLLWDPSGVLYYVRTGSKFLPSFNSGLGGILQGVLASGLVTPASSSGIQLGVLVLLIGFKTSFLGPSGVMYQLGVGGKFLPSWLFFKENFLQGAAASGFVTPASLIDAQPGSVIRTSLVRYSPWHPPGSCFSKGWW